MRSKVCLTCSAKPQISAGAEVRGLPRMSKISTRVKAKMATTPTQRAEEAGARGTGRQPQQKGQEVPRQGPRQESQPPHSPLGIVHRRCRAPRRDNHHVDILDRQSGKLANREGMFVDAQARLLPLQLSTPPQPFVVDPDMPPDGGHDQQKATERPRRQSMEHPA